jgi:hypothetical protein
MPTTLSEQDLKKLARLGAVARLKELEEEIRAIRRMFPGLRGETAQPAEAEAPAAAPRRKRKNRMSKEARQRQAERMRAYWAQRREAKAGAAAEGAAAEQGSKKPRKARRKSR